MELQRIDFEGQPLRILDIDGRPAWVAREVGRALGYEENGVALSRMVTRDWRDEFVSGSDYLVIEGSDLRSLVADSAMSDEASTFARVPRALVLFESGLYLACILSKKPAGRRLRRWLADEVLPRLRREGSYTVQEAPPAEPPSAADLLDDLEGGRLAVVRAREIRLLADGLRRCGATRAEVSALYRSAAWSLAPELEGMTGRPDLPAPRETGPRTVRSEGIRSMVFALAERHADGRPRYAEALARAAIDEGLVPPRAGEPPTLRGVATLVAQALRSWEPDLAAAGIDLRIEYPRGAGHKPTYSFAAQRLGVESSAAQGGAR